MATIHQKAKNGTWYISYRQNGKLKHRSLGTKNAREARRLQKEIEHKLESNLLVEPFVSERPKVEQKNPEMEEFWKDFLTWAKEHRSSNAVDEYTNWFGQFREFSKIVRLGDATREDIEALKASLARQGKKKPKVLAPLPDQHQQRAQDPQGHLESCRQDRAVHGRKPFPVRGALSDPSTVRCKISG